MNFDHHFPPHSRTDWQRRTASALRAGQSPDELASETVDGRTVPPLPPEDVPPVELPAHGASPGARDDRVSIAETDADTANARILAALAGGATSIELYIDEGGDADVEPRGPKGVPVDALRHAFAGVHLSMIGVAARPSGTGVRAAEALHALWRDAGISLEGDRSTADNTADNEDPLPWHAGIRGDFGLDPVGRLLRHGGRPEAVTRGLEALGDVARRLDAPAVTLALVDTTPHHDAGASRVDEIVAAIATGSLYLETLLGAGLAPEDACANIFFRVACDGEMLLETAKLRALRALWNRVAVQAGAGPTRLRLEVETSLRARSTLEPWVNHLRSVAALSAAAWANADRVIVHPHPLTDRQDPPSGDDAATRIARNLSIVLDEEAFLGAVEDPFAGADAIESMTDDLLHAALDELARIGDARAWLASLADGRWAARLTATADRREAMLAAGERVMVGVNRFRLDGESPSAAGPESDDAPSAGSRDETARDASYVVAPFAIRREAAIFDADSPTDAPDRATADR